MKAVVKKPRPAQDRISLTMTRREAEVLKALVGGIGTVSDGEGRDLVFAIYNTLDSAGVDPGICSYHEFFTGSCSTRAFRRAK